MKLRLFDKLLKKFFYRRPQRYKHLFSCIDEYQCRRIMEIGTWNGRHAVKMIKTAKKHWARAEIEYYGFDLFEEISRDTIEAEFSKEPFPLQRVKTKLERTGAKIRLFKGPTVYTLPGAIRDLPPMDFIFIDGGHSFETVRNDWEYAQEVMHDRTVVIFDDYWNIKESGCNRLVDAIDGEKFSVEILAPTDTFQKEWGILHINFVKVMRRTTK